MDMIADGIKLAPSILAADFAQLGKQVHDAESAGADRIHIDVMDGHFVPNISVGPLIVRSLRPITRLPLEAHLMIDAPDQFIDEFAEAGADGIVVHREGGYHLHRTVQRIRRLVNASVWQSTRQPPQPRSRPFSQIWIWCW